MANIFKKFLLIVFILPILFSCTTHYLASWQNEERPDGTIDSRGYIEENGTVGISHAFNSQNGRILIRIENYADKPILVDLTKSALTINGNTFGFIDGKATIYGSISNLGTGTISGFGGEISEKTNTLYIPPQAFVENEFADIRAETRNIMGEDLEGNWSYNSLFNKELKAKMAFYDRESSPITLKSYLNYSMLDTDNQPVKTEVINQNFYLASFFKVRELTQQQFNQILAPREEMSGYSIVRGKGVGLVTLMAGLVGMGVVAGGSE